MGAAIVAGPWGAAGQINATAITGNGEPRLRFALRNKSRSRFTAHRIGR